MEKRNLLWREYEEVEPDLDWAAGIREEGSLKAQQMSLPRKREVEWGSWGAFQMEAAMSVNRWERTNMFKGLKDT